MVALKSEQTTGMLYRTYRGVTNAQKHTEHNTVPRWYLKNLHWYQAISYTFGALHTCNLLLCSISCVFHTREVYFGVSRAGLFLSADDDYVTQAGQDYWV